MASFVRLVLNTPGTSADFQSICPLTGDKYSAGNALSAYFASATGGVFSTGLSAKVGAVQATATLTNTGAATAAQTLILANVTITAVNSGATTNQFNVSATPATQAANIAAAINASPGLSGIVTATSNAGVVTVTSVVPGLVGNGLQISETLANVTLGSFSGGTDGTSYSYDLG